MRITEFEFTPDNHFVAMEYYRLIFNRTFLILITEKDLIGIKVRGFVGVESHDPLVSLLPLSIDGDLQNPYSYMSMKYLERNMNTDLRSNDFFKINSANFKINRSDIIDATYDKTKKWGMGYYSHDGKVYVRTKDYKKREFIILGSQSGEHIQNMLN